MIFIEAMKPRINRIKRFDSNKALYAYMQTVFVAFRLLNILDTDIAPYRLQMAQEFKLPVEKVDEILAMARNPQLDSGIPYFNNFNDYKGSENPTKGIWRDMDTAMAFARTAIHPRRFLQDEIWVYHCTTLLAHLLTRSKRGTPLIEACIYLLKESVKFFNLVLDNQHFNPYIDRIPEAIRFLKFTSEEKQKGFSNWLQVMDEMENPDSDTSDDSS
jgi:hypothetical protein